MVFSHLTQFGYKRSAKQAFGFYLAYVVFGILVGAVLGGIYGAITGVGDFETGGRIGVLWATLLVLALGFMVAKSKGVLNSFVVLLIIIASAALALLIGVLGGLIPIAYLTTWHRAAEA